MATGVYCITSGSSGDVTYSPKGNLAAEEPTAPRMALIQRECARRLEVYFVVTECERRWTVEDFANPIVPLRHGALQDALSKIYQILFQKDPNGIPYRTSEKPSYDLHLSEDSKNGIEWIQSSVESPRTKQQRLKNITVPVETILTTLKKAVDTDHVFEFLTVTYFPDHPAQESTIKIIDIANLLMDAHCVKETIGYSLKIREGIYRILFRATFYQPLKLASTLLDFLLRTSEPLERLSKFCKDKDFMHTFAKLETGLRSFSKSIDNLKTKPGQFFDNLPFIEKSGMPSSRSLVDQRKYTEAFEQILSYLNCGWEPQSQTFKNSLNALLKKACTQINSLPANLCFDYLKTIHTLLTPNPFWKDILTVITNLDSYPITPISSNE